MRGEISALQNSPAKYLDATRTEEPRSGLTLYERYYRLCENMRTEFPELAAQIPASRKYRAENDEVKRSDLTALDQDLEAILGLIA